MKPIEVKGISWSLLLCGLLYFIEFYFELGIEPLLWGGVLLIGLSLWFVFNGFQYGRRINIIWGTINFFVGIALFTFWYFEVVSLSQYILPLMLFTCFALFLMLFIDNTNVKMFLVLSIVSILIFAMYLIWKDTLFINEINQYIALILSYKTLLFIVIGVVFMLMGKDN